MFDYLAQVLILVDVDRTRLAKFVNQHDVSVYIYVIILLKFKVGSNLNNLKTFT